MLSIPRHDSGPFTAVVPFVFVLLTAVQARGETPYVTSSANVAASPGTQEQELAPVSGQVGKVVEVPAIAVKDGFNDAEYLDRFWLVDPRHRSAKPQPDLMRLELHGEYQVRYTGMSDPALSSYGFADYRPSLGQNQRLEHRMRFTPRFTYRENFGIVAQFDLPHGMLVGKATDHVAGDPETMSEALPMRFNFRWLYAEFRFRNGRLNVGQQPARWGSGLVFDSGDERQFFGDPRLGTIVERIAFQGRPLGSDSKLELLLATDWVYADAKARWLDGDRVLRSMVGVSYVGSPRQRIGLLVIGERFQPNFQHAELRQARPTETTATFDVAGETSFPVPGQPAHIVASGETAMVIGSTDLAPEVLALRQARVQRFGAVARLGAVGTRGAGHRRWGKWGLMFEWGYASGDANPGDGVDQRFTANPARRVGLVLFDEVLRWKSARASSAMEDARLGMRPTAGGTVATAGGISGVTYFSLQCLYRPKPNLDLRAATLLAQTTADFVDPVRLITTGRWSNFDGGDPSRRDLGVELDLAAELRQPLDNGLGLSIGTEAGLLLPGRALADASGRSIGAQGLVRGRFGFYF